MKVNINYKGKPVELDIPDEKLEELVKEQKKTGWEKPGFGREYWFVNNSGIVDKYTFSGHDIDKAICGNDCCFTSKELAENIARYQSLDRRIRRRIAEICEPVDWNNYKKPIYLIMCDVLTRELLAAHCHRYRYSIGWYCDTQKHAEQIIAEFKDELLWYFTEFKDRMDG